MQIINKTVQCSVCGCIAFPDAKYCPKCGTSYKANKVRSEYFAGISFFEKPEPVETNELVMKAHCQFICPYHGQINTSTVILVSSIKCPLC
jgi:hypothetical protein